jgi:hypothetical protein
MAVEGKTGLNLKQVVDSAIRREGVGRVPLQWFGNSLTLIYRTREGGSSRDSPRLRSVAR